MKHETMKITLLVSPRTLGHYDCVVTLVYIFLRIKPDIGTQKPGLPISVFFKSLNFLRFEPDSVCASDRTRPALLSFERLSGWC